MRETHSEPTPLNPAAFLSPPIGQSTVTETSRRSRYLLSFQSAESLKEWSDLFASLAASSVVSLVEEAD